MVPREPVGDSTELVENDSTAASASKIDAAPCVSFNIATYNRLDRLQRTVSKIRENVSISHEILVIGGAVNDGTAEWAEAQPDIRLIREQSRQGAAHASNLGFRAARGTYICYINDDAHPLRGSVEAAVAMLERPDLDDVGIVAFYHNSRATKNVLDTVERDGVVYKIFNARGVPYANFGLIRRDLMHRLGYYDERFYTYGTDPDIAMRALHEEGLKVIGCRQALLYHEELLDERKLEDLDSCYKEDNEKFLAKWNPPEKGSYPDPGPAYRRMLEERGLL